MKVKIKKFCESVNCNFKNGEWETYKQGLENDGVSLPIDYEIEGTLIGSICVGKPIVIDRTHRNGLKRPGIFTSSIVRSISENERSVTTDNSVYHVTYDKEYLYTEHGFTKIDSAFLNEYEYESIKEYFEENGTEYFDCGQGYYVSEVELLIYLNEKSYKVTMKADIGSQKMDRGDRLYFAEDIESVSVEEIPTPDPLLKSVYFFPSVLCTEDQYESILNFITKNSYTQYGTGRHSP